MQHGHHDGWEPRRLAVAGLELILEVCEEDADAAGEAQRQPLQQHCGDQDHPCPSPVLVLGSLACCCSSLGHDSSFLLLSQAAGEGSAATMQPSARRTRLQRRAAGIPEAQRHQRVPHLLPLTLQTSCSAFLLAPPFLFTTGSWQQIARETTAFPFYISQDCDHSQVQNRTTPPLRYELALPSSRPYFPFHLLSSYGVPLLATAKVTQSSC